MNASFRLIVLALLLVTSALRAQTPVITGPALPGTERFDAAVTGLMTKFQSPGAQLAVTFNGRLLVARGYGLGDVEAAVPMQPDALIRVASNSKPLTALAILVLVEQGKLTLNQRVFPTLGLTPFPGATNLDARLQTITVQHLLNHTGGWDVSVSGNQLANTTAIAAIAGVPPPADVDSILRYQLGLRLDFDPGTRYVYANLGFVILGRLIEKVSGQAYADFVQANVLAKGGVTRAVLSHSLFQNRQPGEVRYYDYPGAPLATSVYPPTTALVPAPYGGIDLENAAASGGWAVSTVDLVRLLCALDGSKPGPAAIISPASLDLWTERPPAPVSVGANIYYAMGIEVQRDAGLGVRSTWFHTGSLPGARSFFTRFSNGVTYAITFNTRVANDDATDSMGRDTTAALNPIISTFVPPATGDLFATTPPQIVAAPVSRNVSAGTSVIFSATVSSLTSPTYQWFKDGAAIAGATGATLTIANITAASAGTIRVVVTNAAGSTPSTPATLSVGPVITAGRLINLSILTALAGGADSFTMGYVVGGAGTVGVKPLVVRAVGPSLTPLGVGGALADPQLALFSGATQTGANDNWGGGTALADAMTAVGAFAFTGPASRDAAAIANIPAGDNSVKVSPVGNLSGTVIAELYDSTPAASFTATTPRLVNVSVLKNIGTSLTAGFVVGGSPSKTLLIRAIGPSLGTLFGVPGVVADPQLALFNSASAKIGENDNWGGSAALSAVFASVDAFPLTAPASRDAALVATLAPGNYTVQVTGVGNTTGTALVEVYEVP